MATVAKPSAGEQIKNLGANLKKHNFWLLLVVSLATAVGVWYVSTGSLSDAFAANKRRIDGTVGSLNGMRGQPLRNDEMIDEIAKEKEKIVDQAIDAWKVHQERQQPLFRWPNEITARFQVEYYPLGPTPPPGKEIPSAYRNEFQQNLLTTEWENVFTIVDPVNEDAGIVDWPKAMRDGLLQRYLAPQNFPPSDIRVRTAMEDIWIYQNIAEIIRDMNAGASDRARATIKRIRAIEIAQWAIAAAHMHQGPTVAEIGRSGPAGASFSPPQRQGAGHPSDAALLNGRYVDGDNRPIPAGAEPAFAEFRQMFVVLRLVMDQNAIPQLLARCANAPFPIVARQVLVRFQDVDVAPSGQADTFDPAAFNELSTLSPTDALVEVRGLIFLYETPDKAKLGTGTAKRPAHRKPGIPPLESTGP